MKTTLRLEELAQFVAALVAFTYLPFSWWWFPALILFPDLSMVGYLINPRWGAVFYNVAHHKGIALLVIGLGVWLSNPVVLLVGVILFGHASMDRIMGYGLKYPDAFSHTHLGLIGPGKQRQE